MINWFIDSSVLLRIVKENSGAAQRWFQTAYDAGDRFAASTFMWLEVRHVIRNANLDTEILADYFQDIYWIPLDNTISIEADSVTGPITAADAIHVATAKRLLGTPDLVLVTHDEKMARAAARAGIAVQDPVTDDPLRKPVV